MAQLPSGGGGKKKRRRTPRTTNPPTTGLGALATLENARYTPPPRPRVYRDSPKRAQKRATIWAAEQNLPPWEVPAPPRTPKTVVRGARPTRPTRPVSVDQRYRWAQQAPVDRRARLKLAETVTPERRRELTHPARVAQEYIASHPDHPWYERLTPPGVTLMQGLAGALRPAAEERARDFLGTFGALRATSQGPRVSTRQAGFLPPNLVEGVAKVGVSGVGAVGGLARHPVAAAHEMVDLVRGSGEAAVALAALASPTVTPEQRRTVVEALISETLKDLQKRYGSDVSYRDALRQGFDEPVLNLLNAAAVAAPIAKGASVARFMRAGATLEQAVKLSRDPMLADEILGAAAPRGATRRLTVRGKHAEPYQVEASWSRSPISRARQRGYDITSRGLGRAPGLRRLPIAETPRALRAERAQLRRAAHRLRAEGAALWAQVHQYVGKNPEQGARLFHSLQRPPDIPEDVWLRAVASDLEQMMAGRKEIRGERKSAKELELERKLAAFRARVDAETRARWGEKVEDVHSEQQRLGHALINVEQDLRATRRRIRDIEADSEMSEVQRGRELERAKDDERTLLNRRSALREAHADLTVDLPTVTSPARDSLESAVADLPKVNAEERAVIFDIFDARARQWARETGKEPGEWYSDPTGMGLADIKLIDNVADLPQEALTQLRAPRRALEADQIPSEEALRQTVFEGVDLDVFREHKIDDFLKAIPAYLRRGAPFRRWYETSGKEILSFANGDRELAARVAQVVAIYSASRNPRENINLAMEALRQWQQRGRIDVSTADQSRKAMMVMRGEDWGGRKTNRFYANMLKWIDPERYAREFPGGEVTNDIWMARLFGLKTDVPTPGEYEQMTRIQQNIADALGWSPEEVQAALWVPAKADAGRTVTGPGGKKIRVPMTDDEAGIDFAKALNEEAVTVPIEAAPGATAAGLKRTYDELEPEAKVAYMREKGDAVRDYLVETEAFGRLEAEGVGVFKNETNPNFTIRIPMPVERLLTPRGTKTPVSWTSPTARRFMTTVISHIGDALNQDAMAWFRPIYRRDPITKQNGQLLRLSRPLSEQETLRLGERLSDRLGGYVGVPPAAGDRELYVLNYSGAKNKDFHTAVDDVISEIAESDLEVEHVPFRFDGEYRTRSRYTRGKGQAQVRRGEAGRPDVREAARRLRERSAEVDRRYLGTDEDRTPPQVLAQTRQSDLLGAVQYLNGTQQGKRILFLTRNADASTLLHEMVGHGTAEMALHYPREWAEVERAIGRSLAEWTRDDHERFARMSERYFAEGVAPTPELVPAFKHLKRWMRSIYGATRNIERDLPEATKALFDQYFGAYNDENVFRVASRMTSIPTGVRVSQATTLAEFTSEELARLRRRKEIAAYNRSLTKLENEIRAMAERGFDNLTEAEQEIYADLHARALQLRAQQEMAKADRARRLENRYNELQDAMAKPTGPAYEGAFASLQQLSALREQILRSVFGDTYDPVFSKRVDLMADWLVDRGLLDQRDFERGSATYVPHKPEGGGKHPRAINTPARALVTPVVGKTDMSLLTLHRKNNLYRWQSGDIWADPEAVFESWQNAQAFAFIHGLKERMWEVGRPLRVNEPVPDDVYIINRNGIPVPALQRRTMPPSSTDDVMDAVDALDGRDVAAMEEALTKYSREVLMTPEDLQAAIGQGVDPFALDLRVVDKQIVDALFRPLRGGGRSGGGAAWDAANTLARWSLIYTNPMYIPVNFVGNSFFLLAQQGPAAISNLVRAGRMLLNDKYLATRIAGEVGELPAMAAISRGRGGSGRVREVEERALRRITAAPDKWPRMAAWVYEARRMGYRTKEDMIRLIDGKGEQMARKRELVGERATEIMVNFDRMSDWERQSVTRVLFIWPWIRGATAWPFYYAREFPVQTAIAANVGRSAEERRQRIMGEVPSYRTGLFPLEEQRGGRTEVIDVGPLSPTATSAESIATLTGQFMSLFGGQNLEAGQRLLDYVNPLFQFGFEAGGAMTSFGQEKSLQELALQNALGFVPFGNTIQQLADPEKVSRAFGEDRSVGDVVLRRLKSMTVKPQEVSVRWLNAQAQQRGDKETFSDRLARETQKAREDWGSLKTGEPFSQEMQRALTRRLAYEEKAGELRTRKGKDPSFQPHKTERGTWSKEATLTPYEEATLAYAVMQQYPPPNFHYMPSPDQLLRRLKLSPNSERGKLVLEDYKRETFDAVNRPPSQVKRAAEGKRTGKKIEREIARAGG